nr:MAG TPA: hypothetical protein [Caudoviricetes sp.]
MSCVGCVSPAMHLGIRSMCYSPSVADAVQSCLPSLSVYL